jgi:RHS repeat-associated protein
VRQTEGKATSEQAQLAPPLHYNWHRFYDPDSARYLTPDPLGLRAGLNPYAYVDADPVNLVDPTGLWAANRPDLVAAARVAMDPVVRRAATSAFAGAAVAHYAGPAGKPIRDAASAACQAAFSAAQSAVQASRRKNPNTEPPIQSQPRIDPFLPPADPAPDVPREDEHFISLWRTSRRGHGLSDLAHGYNPSNFPYNPPLENGKAYFAKDRWIAQEYSGHGPYEDFLIEIKIPASDYNKYFKKYELPYGSTKPGIEVPIPRTDLTLINRYPRVPHGYLPR